MSLLFSRSHEWVSLKEENGVRVATIGVTDFAMRQLSDVILVNLPQPGDKVTIDKSFGEIETVKAVSDLFSPVNGTILYVNNPSFDVLTKDPFGEGWLIVVALSEEGDDGLYMLMDEETYRKHCESEQH